MHRSKLAGFIIDCQAEAPAAAASFWSAALGMAQRALLGAAGERYLELIDPSGHLHIEVQAVTHPSRVHLDIETDDIEAEVRRLEGLGATRVEQLGSWWVMQAPSGQRFCVVRQSSPDFAQRANTWP
jgi:hypothetical protein